MKINMVVDKDTLREKYFKNKEYYESLAEHHREHDGTAIAPDIKKRLNIILDSFKKEDTVLEMGCGEGSIIRWFANKYPHISFIGTDISPCGIELAQKNSRDFKNIQFLEDNIEYSKIQSNTISLIISHYVIEHLTDYKKALKECFRILCPSGKILISVENAGRKNKGFKGFLKDLVKYILRLNKESLLSPTFELKGKTKKVRTKEHQENFDLVEIPSDVLVKNLKRIGFKINYFTTCKSNMILSEKYVADNLLKKIIKQAYVRLNIFPFNHMGYITVVIAEKKDKI